MKVRKIKSTEHELVRELRLEALRDAPGSFAESEIETSQKPTSYWKNLTDSLTRDNVMFIVELDESIQGSVYGIQDKDAKSVGRIGGMWVSSKYRNRGFGKVLLQSVIDWAKSRNFSEIRLWVPTDNQNAKLFYEKSGFKYTGKSKDDHLSIDEMIFQLS